MRHDSPLYLSSLESERFELVRECRLVRFLTFNTGKIGALVTLTPGISGQDFGTGEDLFSFVLTTRFEGTSISSIDEFPCFVFIALPRQEWDNSSGEITAQDLQVIGWGELYRTAEDATRHKFG